MGNCKCRSSETNEQEEVLAQLPATKKELKNLVDSYLKDLYETAYVHCKSEQSN